jgi:mRNA interferase RelE/StbE
MKVIYQKTFLKELANIPAKQRISIEEFAFEEALGLNSLAESGKIEKLKGFKTYYKIRFGDYRVGLRLDEDTLIFERVLNRKDIYRVFP